MYFKFLYDIHLFHLVTFPTSINRIKYKERASYFPKKCIQEVLKYKIIDFENQIHLQKVLPSVMQGMKPIKNVLQISLHNI